MRTGGYIYKINAMETGTPTLRYLIQLNEQLRKMNDLESGIFLLQIRTDMLYYNSAVHVYMSGFNDHISSDDVP